MCSGKRFESISPGPATHFECFANGRTSFKSNVVSSVLFGHSLGNLNPISLLFPFGVLSLNLFCHSCDAFCESRGNSLGIFSGSFLVFYSGSEVLPNSPCSDFRDAQVTKLLSLARDRHWSSDDSLTAPGRRPATNETGSRFPYIFVWCSCRRQHSMHYEY